MAVERLYATRSYGIRGNDPYFDNVSPTYPVGMNLPEGDSASLLTEFEKPSQENWGKLISSVDVYYFIRKDTDTYVHAGIWVGTEPLPQTVVKKQDLSVTTYTDSLTWTNYTGSGVIYPTLSGDWFCFSLLAYTQNKKTTYLKKIVETFSRIFFTQYTSAIVSTVNDNSHKPYMEVAFGTSVVTTLTDVAPQTGYIPKHASSNFSWNIFVDESQPFYGTIAQASATFRWKASASGTVHTISAGTTQSITVPAETFASTDTVMWQVEVTDTFGNTNTSPWYTLSTVETLSTAEIIAPKNMMVDGSADAVFSWNHIISTGTAQTAAELQKSQNGSSWSTLKNVNGSDTYTTISPNSFTSGQWYWRVRTANSDGSYGSWSTSASIVVVAAPPAPSVSATQTPRPLISWQGTDQQGYQIQIDGIYDSGTVYGTENRFKYTNYLPDGSYVARVRLQNSYGLWSEWSTTAINVLNVPDDAITLSAAEGNSVSLSWTTTGDYEAYAVYRDGKLIAKTIGNSYTDYFSAGSHKYSVKGMIEDSDYYGVSNTVVANAESDIMIMFDANNPDDVINLIYSESATQTYTISENAGIAYHQFNGSEYPSVELSGFKSKSFTFSVSFKSEDEAQEFNRFLGKTVCIQKGVNKVIGILSSYNKRISPFHVTYTSTVTQIDWEDGITL